MRSNGLRFGPQTPRYWVIRGTIRKYLHQRESHGFWEDIGTTGIQRYRHQVVYLTAALMGQMKLRPEQAGRAATPFELDEDEKRLLQEIPYRGSLPTVVPTDPLIYRFYELVQVYGATWKELIQEEFGDGIMSAIDFEMAIERQPDPKGDRVKLTLSGKFLPYKEY